MYQSISSSFQKVVIKHMVAWHISKWVVAICLLVVGLLLLVLIPQIQASDSAPQERNDGDGIVVKAESIQPSAVVLDERVISAESMQPATAKALASSTLTETVYLPVILKPAIPSNGDFETNNFIPWATSGAMSSFVVTSLDIDGTFGVSTAAPLEGSYSAVLGNPAYANIQGVPVGYAEIQQTITLPANAQAIEFKYRIVTHDRIYNSSSETYFDTLEVYIDTADGADMQRAARCLSNPGVSSSSASGFVLCAGNTNTASENSPPVDLGISSANIDVSSRAGETMTLIVRVYNRVDGFYNTWAFVDDFKVLTTP